MVIEYDETTGHKDIEKDNKRKEDIINYLYWNDFAKNPNVSYDEVELYENRKEDVIKFIIIKEFEEDVKSGNDIDIKKYLDNEKKDYTNKITNAMYNLSEKGNKFTRKCITYIFKKLSYLVED